MGRGWVHGVRLQAGAIKGKLFTKIAREIAVAVKLGGSDPENNSRLRSALKDGRQNSMPKDTIDRAIKRGLGGGDESNYDEVLYEGYGPHGVALLVETLTDNKQRTVQDLRATFVRGGGKMGEAGSVQWMFERIGSIVATPPTGGVDAEEAAINAGANEVESLDDGQWHFISDATALDSTEKALEAQNWKVLKGEISYKGKNPVEINEEQEGELKELITKLDDMDDVKKVHVCV